MRVFSCDCHCALVCCSRSSVRCYPPCPPKSQWADAKNVSPTEAPVSVVSEEKPSEERVVAEQNAEEDGKVEISLKSSLKKQPRASDSEQVEKRSVKWMDLLGKELVEIREFETITFDPNSSSTMSTTREVKSLGELHVCLQNGLNDDMGKWEDSKNSATPLALHAHQSGCVVKRPSKSQLQSHSQLPTSIVSFSTANFITAFCEPKQLDHKAKSYERFGFSRNTFHKPIISRRVWSVIEIERDKQEDAECSCLWMKGGEEHGAVDGACRSSHDARNSVSMTASLTVQPSFHLRSLEEALINPLGKAHLLFSLYCHRVEGPSILIFARRNSE
ncbi:hypothetical protein MUK42_10637 [Musa troglodytarum]|uniref:Uncharacterized protein n=1 Tax=Musa troglodytarum TaxID=320322 RepID=A0A9E7GQT4_9LILI|nr:hypothetical protein MUK42_10637 [Musa troglodytarum]